MRRPRHLGAGVRRVEEIQRDADDRYAAEQEALQQKLKDAQAKLSRLTKGEAATANAPLSPDEAKAVDQFRADMLTTRRQLRGVQGALRQDIERLKAVIEFSDIALVPILVALAAVMLGALGLRRWRRRRTELPFTCCRLLELVGDLGEPAFTHASSFSPPGAPDPGSADRFSPILIGSAPGARRAARNTARSSGCH